MTGHMQKRGPYTHLLAWDGERWDMQLLVERRLGDGELGADRAPPSIWGRGIGGNGHAHRTAGGVWGNTEALVWGDGRRGPHSATVLWGKEELEPTIGKGRNGGRWERGHTEVAGRGETGGSCMESLK